jgi:type I restriction enzyme R subunit
VDARNIRNIVLMRPINSVIEFKQIVGRGTRLYDGKDYFTICDFVKAHHHFSDPEWDGEPVEPEPTEPKPPKPYPPDEPAPNPKMSDGSENKPRPTKIKVKLADRKARTIQHMMCTTFWHPDGTPMSAQQFMELLFGKLPDFRSEIEFARDSEAENEVVAATAGVGHQPVGCDVLRVAEDEGKCVAICDHLQGCCQDWVLRVIPCHVD